MTAIKRSFRYINRTKDYGILYDGNEPLITEGYADADWAGCPVTWKSTSGNVFEVAGESSAGDLRSERAWPGLLAMQNI